MNYKYDLDHHQNDGTADIMPLFILQADYVRSFLNPRYTS